MKLFEDNQRKQGTQYSRLASFVPLAHRSVGKPVSHAFAKELLAGFAGGEVDKLAETHGERDRSSVDISHFDVQQV